MFNRNDSSLWPRFCYGTAPKCSAAKRIWSEFLSLHPPGILLTQENVSVAFKFHLPTCCLIIMNPHCRHACGVNSSSSPVSCVAISAE